MGDAAKPPARPGASRRGAALQARVARLDFGQGIAEQRQQRTVDVGQGAAGLFFLIEQTGHGQDVDRRPQAHFRVVEQVRGECMGVYVQGGATRTHVGLGGGEQRDEAGGTILLPRGWTYHSA